MVGPSGAGKSTIVRLLLRECVPQSGTVRVGGHDLNQLDADTLLSQIALVSQDIMLFHGTIEDNLRLGRPDASREQLRAAASAANIDDFIMALPDGYATRIGERGLQLSGGQRQRLAIARALLRDAPILILDEALSSVDAENEALIQQALDRLMEGRSTLILAHRLASVIGADRCLVLDQGRMVESGSHAELMRQGGLYHRLMREQAATLARPADAQADAQADARTDMADAGVARAQTLTGHAGAAPSPAVSASTPVSTTVTRDPREDGRDEPDLDNPQAPGARPLDVDAAQVGWRDTLGTLLSVVRPWRGTLIATILLGVARVAAFIGVGVLSALVVAAIRDGREIQALIIALLATAPLAALFHWLESWLAHAMAYRLLADMRVKLYDKLERLAPAYLLQRRSGDLVALATQDIEMVEYFYAHTIAPAIVSLAVPLSVLGFLAFYSWPVALALLPFLAYALLSPVSGRRRIDALGDRARQALGEMSAHTADTIQGLADLTAFQATGRRRDEFLQAADRYRERRLSMQRDLSRQNANFELAAGLGGLAVAVTGGLQVAAGTLSAGMLPLLVLIALATFLPVSEISQVSRQLADTIAATRRLHVVSHEPVPVNDGPADAPVSTQGLSLAFEHVSFAYPGKRDNTLKDLSFTVPAGAHGGRGGRVRRGQEHRGQPAAALLGSAIGRGPAGRRRPARPEAGQPARAGRAGHSGHLPVQRHAGGQHPAGPPRGQPRGTPAGAGTGRAGGFRQGIARRPAHPRRRTRHAAVGRPAPAHLDRAGVPEERAGADPGRGHLAPGHAVRDAGARRAGHADAPSHHAGDRAPAVHHPRRGPDPGAGPGRAGRGRHARTAAARAGAVRAAGPAPGRTGAQ